MKSQGVYRILLAVILILSATGLALAQTANLSGVITDISKAIVPGATVTLANANTGFKRAISTNDQGVYNIPFLTPGNYTITVQASGFQTVSRTDILLEVGQTARLDFELTVGQLTTTIDVTEQTPLISESSAVGTVIDRQFIDNLPLNGRTFQGLIAMTRGVVLTKATASEQGQFSVNGQRANANYFTVDGVSANVGVGTDFTLSQGGGGGLPALTAAGGTNSLVSIDALQEFQIQTSSYSPEFGRSPGAQVSISTRSGTNAFHGTLFDYFRNDVLDANDWFANRSGFKKAALRQNDFGGTLGGPVIKNRTFFFFSYEGLRLLQPKNAITEVPSLSSRQSATGAIAQILNAFPLPNGANTTTGLARFSSTYSNPSTLNATSIRVDHTLNNKINVFGRFNYAPSDATLRGNGYSLNSVVKEDVNLQTLTVGVTFTITPSLTNDLRVNYSRSVNAGTCFIDDFGGAVPPPSSIFFPSPYTYDNALMGLFLTGSTGQATWLQSGVIQENVQRQVNLVDNFSMVRGKHQLKVGMDYRHLLPIFGPREYLTSYTFAGATGALTGKMTSASIGAADKIELAVVNISPYVQDAWRVTPRLTLTYGLRWEVNPAPKGRNGKDLTTVQGLDNPATLTLAPAGTPLYQTTFSNFAPRFGVAYQLLQRKGSESVLRGGFGLFYDLGAGQAFNNIRWFPYSRSRSLASGTVFPVTDPALNARPALTIAPPVGTIIVADPHLALPATYQWNVALEQSLGKNQSLSTSYVGAMGRDLLRYERYFNPNSSFSQVRVTRNTGTSDYHALQVQFQRRLSRGLQALASYTWSHSLDNVSGDSIFVTPNERIDPAIDRGASDFDVRQAFNAAITYDLPMPPTGAFGRAILGHWSVDTMITSRTATPVDVTFSRNIGFGNMSFRPDVIPNIPFYLANPAVPGGISFNAAAFVIPTALRQGTLQRNVLRGFSVSQVDFTLRRLFKTTERITLEFRADFFNLFNHPNFGDPSGAFGTSLFGQSTQMLGSSLGLGGTQGGLSPIYQIGGPRLVQLALKLRF